MREFPIEFPNAAGLTLRGVLHRPDPKARPRNVVVVLIPGGRKVRSGGWRMYVLAARRLAAQGFATVRFDFAGLGDSDGEQAHGVFRHDWYSIVERGEMTNDVIAAARYALAQTGTARVVLAGICGGAVSGLYAGGALREVYGHTLVDLPVTLCSAELQVYLANNWAERVRNRPIEAEEAWRGYLHKLRDLGAWRRLLSGRSDYPLVRESLRRRVRLGVESAAEILPTRFAAALRAAVQPTVQAEGAGSAERINPKIRPAFHKVIARGQRVHFLNSSSQHELFMAYFGATQLPRRGSEQLCVDVTVVPDSNHSFSVLHAREALFAAIESMALEADAASPRSSATAAAHTSLTHG